MLIEVTIGYEIDDAYVQTDEDIKDIQVYLSNHSASCYNYPNKERIAYKYDRPEISIKPVFTRSNIIDSGITVHVRKYYTGHDLRKLSEEDMEYLKKCRIPDSGGPGD